MLNSYEFLEDCVDILIILRTFFYYKEPLVYWKCSINSIKKKNVALWEQLLHHSHWSLQMLKFVIAFEMIFFVIEATANLYAYVLLL